MSASVALFVVAVDDSDGTLPDQHTALSTRLDGLCQALSKLPTVVMEPPVLLLVNLEADLASLASSPHSLSRKLMFW